MANAAQGSRDLAKLANALKDAGEKDLRRELLRRVREAAKPAIPDVVEAARSTLPRRGGLADRVAAQAYTVRASYAASGARVRIIGPGMKELRDIDAGKVRHPVFGNRKIWKQQSVTPGFFSKTIEKRAPEIRVEVGKAIDDIKHKIDRSI